MGFLDLHVPGDPLLLPNAWDRGSARILEAMGFVALASTSSGFAATRGRHDYGLRLDEVLAHLADLAPSVAVPVSADFENGFADEPADVAHSVRLACDTGVAGLSIEDFGGRDRAEPIYEFDLACERIAAASAVCREAGAVLTGRAENFLHGRDDLDDTIQRLRAYAAAGADVVFAPGLVDLVQIARLVESVDVPVSVLLRPGGPTVPELAAVGVARISVGGAFAYAALGAVVRAAKEFAEAGTTGFYDLVAEARPLVKRGFTGS